MGLEERVLLATLAIALVTVAPLTAAQDQATPAEPGRLFAHWPEGAVPGAADPVDMDTTFPAGEPDLSSGQLNPGSSTAGTLPTFTYAYRNPEGGAGVPGQLELTGDPATLVVYFSADETAVPSDVPLPEEQNPDYGVVANATVDAQLLIDGDPVATGRVTQDLVSTPVTQVVYQYNVSLPLNATTVPAGSSIEVVFQLYQVDQQGERTMQSGWNINTGEAYPTGLLLPVANPSALEAAPTPSPSGNQSGGEEQENGAPMPGALALGGVLAAAAVAARRRS